MFKLFNKNLKSNKGFTLVELLVVIAIIGILIAIAVPRFAAVTGAAERRTAEANHRTLVSVSQLFYAERGVWPADIAALATAGFITAADFAAPAEYEVGPTVVGGNDFRVTVTLNGQTITWTPTGGFERSTGW